MLKFDNEAEISLKISQAVSEFCLSFIANVTEGLKTSHNSV